MLSGEDYLHDDNMSCKFLTTGCWKFLLHFVCNEVSLFPNDLLLINSFFEKTLFWNKRISQYSNYLILQRLSVTFFYVNVFRWGTHLYMSLCKMICPGGFFCFVFFIFFFSFSFFQAVRGEKG